MQVDLSPGTVPAPAARRFTRVDLLLCAGLAIATLAVFSLVLSFRFLPWDDDLAVTTNPHLHAFTFQNLLWMFTNTGATLRYEPLTYVVWTVVESCLGLSSPGFHAVNLLFHAANAVLVYLLIRRILPHLIPAEKPGPVRWSAAAGAALWALHPLRVEVVSWVTQSCFAESAFFSMLTVLLYIAAVERNPQNPLRTGGFWAAALAYALSLLFFASGVGIALVLLLLDLLILCREPLRTLPWKKIARFTAEKIPFLALGLLVGILTIYGRSRASATWAPPPTFAQFPLLDRIAQAGYVFAYYLWKQFDLLHLSPVYTTLIVIDPFSPIFLLSLLFLLAATGFCLATWRHYPLLAAAWFTHLLLIFPYGGYFDHPHYTNDRYAYLDGVLWCAVAGFLLLKSRRQLRPALLSAAFLLAAILGFLSIQYEGRWRNGDTLFQGVLADLGNDPYSVDIHAHYAKYLAERGRMKESADQIDAALALGPTYPPALDAKAQFLTRMADDQRLQGRPPQVYQPLYLQAAQTYDQELQQNHKLQTLIAAAFSYAHAGSFDTAVARMQNAIRAVPSSAQLHLFLAEIDTLADRPGDAAAEVDAALKLDPTLAPRINTLRQRWEAERTSATAPTAPTATTPTSTPTSTQPATR